jgi:hypothetical protein
LKRLIRKESEALAIAAAERIHVSP